MSRTTRCTACTLVFDVATDTGPLPSKCDFCDPDAAARREENRERSRQGAAARRQELVDLRARVADLEQQLRTGLPSRRDPRRAAGRDTLAIAVRRVGHAEGRHQTAERLHELAAEALAWAAALGVTHEPDPSVHLEDIAA